ncbi:transcription factor, partial [Ascosphaera atra]
MKWMIAAEYRDEYRAKQFRKSGNGGANQGASSNPSSPARVTNSKAAAALTTSTTTSPRYPVSSAGAASARKPTAEARVQHMQQRGLPSPLPPPTPLGFVTFNVGPNEAYTPDRGSRGGSMRAPARKPDDNAQQSSPLPVRTARPTPSAIPSPAVNTPRAPNGADPYVSDAYARRIPPYDSGAVSSRYSAINGDPGRRELDTRDYARHSQPPPYGLNSAASALRSPPTLGYPYHDRERDARERSARDRDTLPPILEPTSNGVNGLKPAQEPNLAAAANTTIHDPASQTLTSTPGPFITPAPRRMQQPKLAPPSTAHVPSKYMPLSSPAQFWKFAAEVSEDPMVTPAPPGGSGLFSASRNGSSYGLHGLGITPARKEEAEESPVKGKEERTRQRERS